MVVGCFFFLFLFLSVAKICVTCRRWGKGGCEGWNDGASKGIGRNCRTLEDIGARFWAVFGFGISKRFGDWGTDWDENERKTCRLFCVVGFEHMDGQI
jgi:hypothetical protein